MTRDNNKRRKKKKPSFRSTSVTEDYSNRSALADEIRSFLLTSHSSRNPSAHAQRGEKQLMPTSCLQFCSVQTICQLDKAGKLSNHLCLICCFWRNPFFISTIHHYDIYFFSLLGVLPADPRSWIHQGIHRWHLPSSISIMPEECSLAINS